MSATDSQLDKVATLEDIATRFGLDAIYLFGGRATEYELYVLRRAGDLAPFERERRQRVFWEKRA